MYMSDSILNEVTTECYSIRRDQLEIYDAVY